MARESAHWRIKIDQDEALVIAASSHPAKDLETFVLDTVHRSNNMVDTVDLRLGYRSSVWIFASILKGAPELRTQEAWEVVSCIDESLESHGGWELLSSSTSSSSYDNAACFPRDAFLEVWDSIQTPLVPAFEPARILPLVAQYPLTSVRWSSVRDASYRRAATVCFWYSWILSPCGNFFLSCRTLGTLINVPYQNAAAYLRRLCAEKVLCKREDKGTVRKERNATEYQFQIEAVIFASLNEGQHEKRYRGIAYVPD